MRNQFLKAIGHAPLFAAAALLLSAPAWGQSTVMHVQVPFEFHAGTKTMPAGLYRFEIDRDRRVLLLGPNGQQALMVPPMRDYDQPNREQSGVAFRKYGQDYFLARIVSQIGSGYYEWPPTSVEKVLSKRANVQMAWVRPVNKITP